MSIKNTIYRDPTNHIYQSLDNDHVYIRVSGIQPQTYVVVELPLEALQAIHEQYPAIKAQWDSIEEE